MPDILFKNDQVIGALLSNGTRLHIDRGTYREFIPRDAEGNESGPEIFTARDTCSPDGEDNMVGETSNIIVLWFVDEETEEETPGESTE